LLQCELWKAQRKFATVRFYKIPTGRKNEDWGKKLIVEVNRADTSFDPSKAFICSVHFKPDCQYVGEKLIL